MTKNYRITYNQGKNTDIHYLLTEKEFQNCLKAIAKRGYTDVEVEEFE